VNDLERVEAQALRDAVTLGGGRAGTAGGAMCVTHPRIPIGELNRAIPIGEVVDVAAVAEWFAGAAHMVCAPPAYLGLDRQLEARGYTEGAAWCKFHRGSSPAPAALTGLRVEETLDRAAFALACGEGSGMPADVALELSAIVGAPGWSCFVSWDGDEPAGTGALYADGEHGWLGVAATREAFRGRGSQSAILSARIDRARELGVRALTTETGVADGPSDRNIRRAGFTEAYVRANWHSRA
jgi:GNAT superfamily N-acetyltransferase